MWFLNVIVLKAALLRRSSLEARHSSYCMLCRAKEEDLTTASLLCNDMGHRASKPQQQCFFEPEIGLILSTVQLLAKG